MRLPFLIAVAILGSACGSKSDGNGTGTDAGNNANSDACSGSATRCDSNNYQTCVGGTFTTQMACPNLCSEGSGCYDCDPTAGSAACNGSAAVACNADGTFGTTIMTCGAGETCSAGTCSETCTADGVDLVYVVDEANDFISFDPRKLATAPPTDPFTKIGTLNCPTKGKSLMPKSSAVQPQSMSVDRNGVAWVEYTSGEIFNVSLTDASCTATAYVAGTSGMQLFGMGFSTDAAGGNTETLFLAGGGNDAQPKGKLASMVPATNNLTPTILGTLNQSADYSPELTGTNAAELFGFFPVLQTPAYVQQIDKTSGAAVGPQFMLGTMGLGSTIRDWAFAQWGGVFYVFVTTADKNGQNQVSTVRAVDRMGNYSVAVAMPSFSNIDGAGVSTCAPSVLQ